MNQFIIKNIGYSVECDKNKLDYYHKFIDT